MRQTTLTQSGAPCCVLHVEHLLDQFLTLASNTWISSELSLFYWIYLLFILRVSVGVELLLSQAVALP